MFGMLKDYSTDRFMTLVADRKHTRPYYLSLTVEGRPTPKSSHLSR